MTVMATESGTIPRSLDSQCHRPYLDVPDSIGQIFKIDAYLASLLDRFTTSIYFISVRKLKNDALRADLNESKSNPMWTDLFQRLRTSYTLPEAISGDRALSASGALSVDVHDLFGDAPFRSTPLVLLMHGDTSFGSPARMSKLVHQSATSSLLEADLPKSLTASHGTLLNEIYDSGFWSWRDLEPIIGSSHTHLQRIAKGALVPSVEVGRRIDETHRFVTRLRSVTRENRNAMRRALTLPRERDSLSAQDRLAKGEYREAFGAVMDALSTLSEFIPTETRPLKWYNEPSVAIHDSDSGDANDD